MEFKTLADSSIKDILAVFNLSFSDYVVPFHLTEEQLIFKINAEKIDLNLSVGAFEDGELAGFILQAEKNENGETIIYNGGTGIVPEHRGKGLVRKMYDFIIPILKKKNADVLLLEVIEGNNQAIRAYENLGFTKVRRLLCFNGNIKSGKRQSAINIRELKEFQWDKFRSFWDIEPSWQGCISVLDRIQNDLITFGAYENEKLIGYLIYNPVIRKIYQIAVDKDYRRNGVGTSLFDAVGNGQPVSFNNIDDVSENTSRFLSEKVGLTNWISQFEMKRFL